MTRVLGIDPGGTTGLAMVAFEDGRYALKDHGGITGRLPETMATLRPFTMLRSVPIAIERFVVNRRAGRSATAGAGEKARDIIGAVQMQAISPVHLHTAAEAKAWATDKRLTAAGLRPTAGLPHSRDACRHALYTLVKHYGCPDPLSSRYGKDHDQ